MRLLIRADAGAQIGSGHLARCLALAQACLAAGGDAIFLVASAAPTFESSLRSEGMRAERISKPAGSAGDAIQTAETARRLGATWVVLDGEHFDARYQLILRDAGCQVACIDDTAQRTHYYADVVVNPNLCVDESGYAGLEPDARLLLGSQYALLRDEFAEWRRWTRPIPEVARKVLVTLGGSDPNNTTAKVIDALAAVPIAELETLVVVGGLNPNYGSLACDLGQSSSTQRLRVVRDAANMPELMAWADIAIIASGGTLWELLFMACPLVSFVRIPLQENIIRYLDRTSAAVYQGYEAALDTDNLVATVEALALDQERRRRMGANGRALVDGLGAIRVVEALGTLPVTNLRQSRGA